MKVLRAIGVEDGVRTVAGRSQWQVMRNWKTGRVIGRTSRQEQEASVGIPSATGHTADLTELLAQTGPRRCPGPPYWRSCPPRCRRACYRGATVAGRYARTATSRSRAVVT